MNFTNISLAAALATTLLVATGCAKGNAPAPNIKVRCDTHGCVQNFAKMEIVKVNDLSSRKPETRIMKWVSIHFTYNESGDQTAMDHDFSRAGWIRAGAELPVSASPKMLCTVTFTQQKAKANTTACWSHYGSITPGDSTLYAPRVINYVATFERLHDLLGRQTLDKQ
jgi:hypothetical protein